ncbi:MAG: hypothetical protein MK195_09560 [Acidimicrobiales bacterium]|nr:hypothetical protein [Acidimicrobiales bacterium]
MKLRAIFRTLPKLIWAPVKIRKSVNEPPTGKEHFNPPKLSDSLSATTVKATDIPVAFTPPGGYREFPPPVLVGCDEPIVPGAPDLRGVWQVYKGPLKGHIERVEQAGNRVVVTGGGVIHDMYADGTLDGGVNDVHADKRERISVAARFEKGRLNLYPGGRKIALVTRYLDGEEMIWRYGPYKNHLKRLKSREI